MLCHQTHLGASRPCHLKGCSHGAIATAILLWQQMSCLGFNVSVYIVCLQQEK